MFRKVKRGITGGSVGADNAVEFDGARGGSGGLVEAVGVASGREVKLGRDEDVIVDDKLS